MPTRDLSAVFDRGDLTYPGVPSKAHPAGQTYVVKAPDATEGLRLTTLADLAARATRGENLAPEELAQLALDDDQERTLYQRVLGPVYEQMVTDGVSWPLLNDIGRDAYLCFSTDPTVADLALMAGSAEGNPPARPNRATRRGKTSGTPATPRKRAGSKSSPASTATPGPTPSPASTRSSTSARKPRTPKA